MPRLCRRSTDSIRCFVDPLEPRRLLTAAVYPSRQALIAANNFVAVDAALADFTGDGVPDLVSATLAGVNSSVNLSPGSPDGSFDAFTAHSPASFSIASLAVADLTGDGRLDLAVASASSSGSIRIIPGVPGGLGAALSPGLATGSNTRKVIAADVTGDGKLDLIAANSGSGNVSVLIQTAPGTFAPAVNYATGSQAYSVTAADFNRDGLIDVVAANNGASSLSFLRNTGAGSLASAVHIPVASSPRVVVSGDFNADAKPDLAVAHNSSASVSILLGDGAGGFATPAVYNTHGSLRSLTAADVNADGKTDLLVGAFIGNRFGVLRGVGDGAFVSVGTYSAGNDPSAIPTGDVNGDGMVDVVVTSSIGRHATVALGRGDGSFVTADVLGAGTSPRHIAVGDINNDGKLDVALANDGGGFSGTVRLLFGDGNGGLGSTVAYPTAIGTWDVRLADFNNDGRLDIATAGTTPGRVAVHLQAVDGSFTAHHLHATNGGTGGLVIGDYNADGFADIIAINRSNNSVVGQPTWGAAVLLNNGAGAFPTATEIVGAGVQSYSGVAGDFNRDGKLDLALNSPGLASNHNVRLIYGNGDGTFGAPVAYPVGSEGGKMTAADFNGDGWLDLAAPTTPIFGAELLIFLNNAAGQFLAPVRYPIEESTIGAFSVEPLDFDGDGTLDLVVGASDGGALLFKGAGNGSFARVARHHVSGSVLHAMPVDLNADGRADLLAAAASANALNVLMNLGGPDTAPPTVLAAAIDVQTAQRVVVTLNEPIDPLTVSAADLLATRLSGGQTFAPACVAIAADNRSITFTFSGLPDGNYRFRLPAGAVADPSGNALLADYDFQTVDTFILAGDANRDRAVNIADFSIVASRFNLPGTFLQGDFNYSGTTDIGDFAILASRFNTQLAASETGLRGAGGFGRFFGGGATVEAPVRPVAGLFADDPDRLAGVAIGGA